MIFSNLVFLLLQRCISDFCVFFTESFSGSIFSFIDIIIFRSGLDSSVLDCAMVLCLHTAKHLASLSSMMTTTTPMLPLFRMSSTAAAGSFGASPMTDWDSRDASWLLEQLYQLPQHVFQLYRTLVRLQLIND